jgi:RHS repeat-associated protein
VDALVLRDRDANGQSGDGLEERLYVQQDGNWNVTALVNGSGNVAERHVYDSYGKVTFLNVNWGTLSGSAYAWVYLHQGGRYDATSDLHHFRSRDYSATLGRWMQLDPLQFNGGDVNYYRYGKNTPINETDPLGLGPVNATNVTSYAPAFTVITGSVITPGAIFGVSGNWGQPWWDVDGSYTIDGNTASSTIILTGTTNSGGVCNTVCDFWTNVQHSGSIIMKATAVPRTRLKVTIDLSLEMSLVGAGTTNLAGSAWFKDRNNKVLFEGRVDCKNPKFSKTVTYTYIHTQET